MTTQSQLHRAERNYSRQEPKWGKTMDESQVEKLADEMMQPGRAYDPFEAQNFLDALDDYAASKPDSMGRILFSLRAGKRRDIAGSFFSIISREYSRQRALDAARNQLENEE